MSTPAVPWKRLYNDVKMHIPGVPDAVLQQMLYHVLNDFLSLTNIWTEEVPFVLEPDVISYPVPVTHKGDPKRLLLVYDQAQVGPNKHWVTGGAQMLKPGVVTLNFIPTATATYIAVIAKVLGEPTDSANYPEMEEADHWIIDQYGDGIEYGVLGRLQAMPAKPYTNAKLSTQNWQVYVTERGRARTDALKANTYGGQRWLFPQSFATVMRRGGF